MSISQKIIIRELALEDENIFLSAMQRSHSLHYPWVKAPETAQEFTDYYQRFQQANQKSFLVCDQSGSIAGVFNISEIVRGQFQNAYLGFHAVLDFTGKGYMSAGLKLVEPTSRHWSEKIKFRDYLILHPDAAKKYQELKIKLAHEYAYDREKYTNAKGEFIRFWLRLII